MPMNSAEKRKAEKFLADRIKQLKNDGRVFYQPQLDAVEKLPHPVATLKDRLDAIEKDLNERGYYIEYKYIDGRTQFRVAEYTEIASKKTSPIVDARNSLNKAIDKVAVDFEQDIYADKYDTVADVLAVLNSTTIDSIGIPVPEAPKL